MSLFGTIRQPGWQAALLSFVCLAGGACSTPFARIEAAVTPCGVQPSLASPVRWVGVADVREAERRRNWCEPVGPVAIGRAPDDHAQALAGDLLVVSWNVAVGAGDVSRLLRELSDEEHAAGRGEPAFVMLLQEAYRAGTAVPARFSSHARVPRRIASGVRQQRDVESLAASLHMHFVYVPSMRNGRSAPGEPAEDRGNAILSSLPLRDAAAIELPVEHQRRVAVAATVDVQGLPLKVVSVHLDTRRPLLRGSVFSGPFARRRQAAALIAALSTEQARGPVVIGGDFNTLAGAGEPAIRSMERRFARAACGSPVTHQSGLALDYVFTSHRSLFQECTRAAGRFDSDHYPLIARVRRSAPPTASAAVQRP